MFMVVSICDIEIFLEEYVEFDEIDMCFRLKVISVVFVEILGMVKQVVLYNWLVDLLKIMVLG